MPDKGSLCFYPSISQIWSLAKVVDIQNEGDTCSIVDCRTGETMNFMSGELVCVSAESERSLRPKADLMDLEILHEAGILHWLRKRVIDERKPSTRLGRIALNFKSDIDPRTQLPLEAYWRGLSGEGDQLIPLLGTAGSDKISFTSSCIRGLLKCGSVTKTFSDQLQAAASLLHTFGSALTTSGEQLPCFSATWSFSYSKSGQLSSAHVTCAALEASRILSGTESERMLNPLYMLVASNDASKYLASTGNDHVEEFLDPEMDAADYTNCVSLMNTLEMDEKTKDGIWRAVSAAIHFSTIEITSNKVSHSSTAILRLASGLIGIDPFTVDSLLANSDQAAVLRDCIACAIYESLFNYIVSIVNSKITSESPNDLPLFTISIINVGGQHEFSGTGFGVEELFRHSICEMLEGRYRSDVITKPRLESTLELNNAEAYVGLPRPPGPVSEQVLAVLFNSERGLFTKANHSYDFELHANITKLTSPLVYATAPDNNNELPIVVHHTFGAVKYDITGCHHQFNSLHDDVLSVFESATLPCLKFSNKASGFQKLTKYLKKTAALFNNVQSSSIAWTRCLSAGAGGVWSGASVIEQLRYFGVMYILHSARGSHDLSLSKSAFKKKFSLIENDPTHTVSRDVLNATASAKVGISRVFLRSSECKKMNHSVITVTTNVLEAFIRSYLAVSKCKARTLPKGVTVKSIMIELRSVARTEVSKRELLRRQESTARSKLTSVEGKRKGSLFEMNKHSLSMAQAAFLNSLQEAEGKKRMMLETNYIRSLKTIRDQHFQEYREVRRNEPSESICSSSSFEVTYDKLATKVSQRLFQHNNSINNMTKTTILNASSIARQRVETFDKKRQLTFEKRLTEEKRKRELEMRRIEKEDRAKETKRMLLEARQKGFEDKKSKDDRDRQRRERVAERDKTIQENKREEWEWESVERSLMKQVEDKLDTERRHMQEKVSHELQLRKEHDEATLIKMRQRAELKKLRQEKSLDGERKRQDDALRKAKNIEWRTQQEAHETAKKKAESEKRRRTSEWEKKRTAKQALNTLATTDIKKFPKESIPEPSISPLRGARTAEGEWVPLSQRLMLEPVLPEHILEPRILGSIIHERDSSEA